MVRVAGELDVETLMGKAHANRAGQSSRLYGSSGSCYHGCRHVQS